MNFLLAVSGGVDSVVLCELCHRISLKFSIAHCNFRLRAEESERDESFVRDLGGKYGVEVLIEEFDTEKYAAEKKISIQEAARELRYDWFNQLKKEKGFDLTLTAHHADDNIETLLMNFFRGTGLQGLTAIPEINRGSNHIFRPLLHVSRQEIEAFAKANQLQWVEDSSNNSLKYTRNYFRKELIPAIQKVFPQVQENLLNNIERFKKVNSLYKLSVEELKKKICEQHEQEVRIPVKKILQYSDTALIYEVIKDYGFGEKQVEEVLKLAEAESGKFIENEKYQFIRHRNWFIIADKQVSDRTIPIEKDEDKIHFPLGMLRMKRMAKEKFNLDKSASIAQLDAKGVEYPLTLRRWKQGDYFYPLGLGKKKKLARFFIDQKLPKNQKENVWVLESNRKILWVVGMRIDDRFKITESTKDVLKISLSSL
ncbi:MAG: tRNA lysidine(34) synthetase TilS [Flavisolibacter sp.]